MEHESERLSKKETAAALGMEVTTLSRYIRKGWFPGPSIIEGKRKWWTMKQVERFCDDPRP